MNMRILVSALALLVFASMTPASAGGFKIKRPDNWQCAYGYNAAKGVVWLYGEKVQYKPEARSTALQYCRAQAKGCVFLGCFRRL